jgi:perosamine synthetase
MISIASPQLGEREQAQLLNRIEDGELADGPEVRKFESEFAEYCGAAHGIATSNGTTALHTALHALGLGRGDRVLTTPFSFVASANAIRLCGAEPVFADIDPETFTLDPRAVEETISEENGDIDAILVVHLYGLAANMGCLSDIADDYGLLLVEDAAQAHGAEYEGRRVGSFGDAACFSFYPTKNMTTGEGGMVLTDRKEVATRAAQFVNHGRANGDRHVEVGHNFRMTSLAAAIGRVQLDRLPGYIDKRRSNANRLSGILTDGNVVTPAEPDWARHVYNQYTVRCEDRDALQAHLEERAVSSQIYYPTPIYEQPAYRGYDVSCPVTERTASDVLSLPIHPGLSESDIKTVARAVLEHQSVTSH